MNKVWDEFMNTPYAKEALAKIQHKKANLAKEGQAYSVNMDRDKLYDVGWHEDYLSPSVETQGVSGKGGGSNVGSGDRGHLYTVPTAPTQGGAEAYADATVEGLADVASRMEEVARKAPHGNPRGTQDNKAENWEGLKAAGKGVKSFTKQAQEQAVQELIELTSDEVSYEQPSNSSETLSFLEELVGIADSLDQEGRIEEATEIDQVIAAEIKSRLSKRS